jgi:hypothetical protein
MDHYKYYSILIIDCKQIEYHTTLSLYIGTDGLDYYFSKHKMYIPKEFFIKLDSFKRNEKGQIVINVSFQIYRKSIEYFFVIVNQVCYIQSYKINYRGSNEIITFSREDIDKYDEITNEASFCLLQLFDFFQVSHVYLLFQHLEIYKLALVNNFFDISTSIKKEFNTLLEKLMTNILLHSECGNRSENSKQSESVEYSERSDLFIDFRLHVLFYKFNHMCNVHRSKEINPNCLLYQFFMYVQKNKIKYDPYIYTESYSDINMEFFDILAGCRGYS